MPAAASVRFAATARLLSAVCRAQGLTAPAFRSPPRAAGLVRTVRRPPDGGAVIAVRIRGRPFGEVVTDMVEGVLVANHLQGATAEGHRAALLAAAGVADDDDDAQAA